MLPFAYYLLKIIICSAVFFTYYRLVLRNKVFHSYNRFYLLACIVFSLLLPAVRFQIFKTPEDHQNRVYKMLDVVSAGDEYVNEKMVQASGPGKIDFAQYVPYLYVAVCLVFCVMLLQTFWMIYRLLRRYPVTKGANFKFINTNNEKGTPFSFFKYIFWNSEIDPGSVAGSRILRHEIAHIRERHSLDKIFINLVIILFWINPVFWFIRREINMIHEFEADKRAIGDGDVAMFSAMILTATFPRFRMPVTNNFFFSPIKRRLMMLSKNQHPRVNYLGRLAVLPLAAILFAAFTFRSLKSDQPSPLENASAELTDAFRSDRNLIVVLDAGHGGDDAGARNLTDLGIIEKDLSLQLVKRIAAMNQNKNVTIVLLRDDDVYLNPGEKASKAASYHPDIFISVHMDGAPRASKDKSSGMTVFVSKNNFANSGQSKKLASALIGSFQRNYGINVNAQPYQRQSGIQILQSNPFPSVIIEAGFITNDRDVKYLLSNEGQLAFATNTLNAINSYAVSDMRSRDAITNETPDPGDTLYFVNGEAATLNEAKAAMTTHRRTTITYLSPEEAFRKYQVKTSAVIIDLTTKGREQISTGAEINDQLAPPPPPPPPPPPAKERVVMTKVEKDPEFPGGTEAWREFVRKNLDYSVPLSDQWKPGTYRVEVKFLVRSDGQITDIESINYRDSRTASYCRDVIKKSPRWIPALNNGRHVEAYSKQIFTFVVDGEVRKSFAPAKPSAFKSVADDQKPFYDPVFRIGNLTASLVSADVFRKQITATATDGYKVISATVYFSGTGFKEVAMAALKGEDLQNLSGFLDRCVPGTSVTFVNIKVAGPRGLMTIEEKSYTLF